MCQANTHFCPRGKDGNIQVKENLLTNFQLALQLKKKRNYSASRDEAPASSRTCTGRSASRIGEAERRTHLRSQAGAWEREFGV